MTNAERLQKELGDGFRVLRWVTAPGYLPDEVVIERTADKRYEVFRFEKEMLQFDVMSSISNSIKAQFARVEITNQRQNAFEHIVRNQELSLRLDRLSNGSRYESMETEWAFRFYCKGLDACVGWPVKKAG